MTGNQPVYRNRPRSHAYSCRCPRCVQVLNRQSASGSGGFWTVVALMVLYGLPAGIWHQGTGMVVACAIWWPVLTVSTAAIAYGSYLEKHPKQRPARRGPLPAEALRTPPPAPPPSVSVARPACRHLNAVKVESVIDPDKAVAYWCEECGTQLDEKFGRFARPCCGTPPGGWHRYNCPHRL